MLAASVRARQGVTGQFPHVKVTVFRRFGGRGCKQEVELGVDGSNGTGAVR
jgi:hypothetical protein